MLTSNTHDSATDLAVRQLKAYGRYIYDNADSIIGNIDAPTYVVEGGIYVSFTLCQHDVAPTLSVTTEYLVDGAL